MVGRLALKTINTQEILDHCLYFTERSGSVSAHMRAHSGIGRSHRSPFQDPSTVLQSAATTSTTMTNNASWERYRSLTMALVATLLSAGMLYLLSGTSLFGSLYTNKALPPPVEEDVQEAEPTPEEESVDKELINKQIEEYDAKARGLFKEKKHIEAAAVFTKAIELADNNDSKQFQRQLLSLKNNRAAMYEKAGMIELALEDCDAILALDNVHSKARTRKLRILESQKRYQEALVEICALQLRFMHDNRDKIR